MLAMNRALMRGMSTRHLLASLGAEGHLTPAQAELADRLESTADEFDKLTREFSLFKEVAEVVEEQSEFKSQLLNTIKRLCGETGGTKRDLVAAIKQAFSESFVEL